MTTRSQDGARSVVAEASLVAIAAVWGLTFPLVQDAVAEVPVTAFLAYRFLSATTIVAVVFHRELRRLSADGWRAGIAMGIFLAGGYFFQTLGLERTSASHAGFITGLWVVFTPIFGAIFLRQRIGALPWAAAFVSALGLLLLSMDAGGRSSIGGDALVLVCAISFTFHIFATDRGVRDHDVGALLVVQLGVVGVAALLLAIPQGELVVPDSGTVWGALAVTAVIASALGFFIQTYAQQHASPTRTALILASEPAFAGLFAYLLKGETLSGAGWVGAGLILMAIVAVEVIPQLRPAQPPLPEV